MTIPKYTLKHESPSIQHWLSQQMPPMSSKIPAKPQPYQKAFLDSVADHNAGNARFVVPGRLSIWEKMQLALLKYGYFKIDFGSSVYEFKRLADGTLDITRSDCTKPGEIPTYIKPESF